MNQTKDIWVLIETAKTAPKPASLEALAKAEELAKAAGGKAVALTLPQDKQASAADAALAIAEALKAETPAAIFLAATAFGRDVSAVLSAKAGLGVAADCTGVSDKGDLALSFLRPTYDGKLNAAVSVASRPQLATFLPGTLGAAAAALSETKALQLPAASALHSELVEFVQDAGLAEANIEEAKVIVSGGRGVGSAEGFAPLRELAALLGGSIGVTRPVADEGWVARDYQIGVTGKTVSPKLYIACGISGAPAHVGGMKSSETIVAINTDPNAPICKIAHYCIIGDLHKVVPELIQAIKEARAQ